MSSVGLETKAFSRTKHKLLVLTLLLSKKSRFWLSTRVHITFYVKTFDAA